MGKRMARPAKVRLWCLNIPNPNRSPVDGVRLCADAVAEAHIPARTIAPTKAERVLPIRSLLTMPGLLAVLLCLHLVSEAAAQGKIMRLKARDVWDGRRTNTAGPSPGGDTKARRIRSSPR